MLKPIEVLMCKNCGEVHLVANRFWAFIFEHFLIHFWNGAVHLYDIEIEKLEDLDNGNKNG